MYFKISKLHSWSKRADQVRRHNYAALPNKKDGISMYFFRNDYSEGALPQVMEALNRTNLCSTVGYGLDPYCREAAEKIRHRFQCPDADVHFLVGGTQTNQTVIAAALRPWEAAIAADTGHINVHETGAIEATGHKVCTAPHVNGKLTADAIRTVFAAHGNGKDEHMVAPKLVYISNATELGTVYTKKELEDISHTCRELGLYLFLDGARLAPALTSPGNKVTPEDLADLCDAFYIGGTKNGLLFGEALIITRDSLKGGFRHAIKQRGGMLAKGRLLGLQFSTILDDDLWLQAGAHANEQAARLSAGLKDLGYDMVVDSPTNQLFPILENGQIARLEQEFSFEHWAAVSDTHTAVRFVTSWATKPEAVDALLAALRR